MISWRALSGHLVALGVASAVALIVWTRKDPEATTQKGNVEVWGGSADAVEKIVFEAENRSVRLERRKDSHGLWYVGNVDKTIEVKPPSPHGDAGAGDAADPSAGDAGPPAEKKRETTTFVSVEQGKKLAESLAPLLAVRRLGKLDDARAAEFGFDKPEGTLKVTVSGRERTLTFGGATPGGGDRYVKVDGGEMFAIGGSVAQSVLFAESRLVERNLHGYEADELKSAKIERGTLSREVVRVEDKKDGWADATTPMSLDETAGNWMSKLDRLRIVTFVESPSGLGPDSSIVKVELFGKGGRKLGFLELYKVPGEGGKPKFLVKTEHTRWHAEVISSVAEQVEQDLGSVVKAN
ncbi:MAG: DUF4340 domain-containing protein [Myxococcales bacterium]|nr:DUF4340 domain-containing protein [Myxococcales bacterium]